MMINILTIGLSFITLILFLVLNYLIGKKCSIDPEWQRKILHIGLGLFTLSFPFIFKSTIEVLLLFALCLIVLISIRLIPRLRNAIGNSLFSINRSSLGEFFFIISVANLFWITKNEYVFYLIPILILTLSDTAACFVGIKYGKKKYEVIDTTKSFEGSLGFFIVTFCITLTLIIQLTNISLIQSILICLLLAILSSLIEATSWHGMDNFFVPISFYLMLKSFTTLDTITLCALLAILLTISLIIIISAKKTQLNTHALLSAVIFSFFFWVVGGLQWFLALAIVLAIHIFMVKIQNDDEKYGINSILSISSGGIIWVGILKILHYNPSYFLFVLSLAIHLQIILLIRLRRHFGTPSNAFIKFLVSIFSVSIFQFIFFLFYPQPEKCSFFGLYCILILFLGSLLFRVTTDNLNSKRWFYQGIFAILGSLIGIIPLLIHGGFHN